MEGVTQDLQFIAMKTVTIIREQMNERDHSRDGEHGEGVVPRFRRKLLFFRHLLPQRLQQIFDQIIAVFETDGDSQKI